MSVSPPASTAPGSSRVLVQLALSHNSAPGSVAVEFEAAAVASVFAGDRRAVVRSTPIVRISR